jgi:Na+:H+ antiporter, NhaC family
MPSSMTICRQVSKMTNRPEDNVRTVRKPTFGESIMPIVVLAALLAIGYGVFQYRIELLLLTAAAVTGIVGYRLGFDYKTMENGVMDSIRKGLPAMSILIIVGALIGSWLAAGTIPMLIYYGLRIISPQYFLVTACIVCSIVSVLTGTSYGTVGTVGIAFIGIAHGFDIPLGMAAGAIVAGAYFGDKISPFSDTTNLAPIAAGSNLFDHIRHTLWTTTPAWLLGLLVYFVAGLQFDVTAVESDRIVLITSTIAEHYSFHVLLLIPPIIVLYATVRQLPVIPGMLASTFTAMVLAMIFQSETLGKVIEVTVFGYASATGIELVDSLLSRGGMQQMMNVTLIALCAFAFAGIAQVTGMLEVILDRLLRFARTTGRLIAATVSSCMLTAFMTGSSYLSILLPGELFAPAYKRKGLAAKNLSRTTEDSGTVMVPLVPWSIAGVFMAGTLGVPTLQYVPWAVMCYSGWIFALVYGFTGFKIAPKIREDETIPGS